MALPSLLTCRQKMRTDLVERSLERTKTASPLILKKNKITTHVLPKRRRPPILSFFFPAIFDPFSTSTEDGFPSFHSSSPKRRCPPILSFFFPAIFDPFSTSTEDDFPSFHSSSLRALILFRLRLSFAL
ncbi:hypothetical protein O6P43_014409 [Quillaja saponaria]|uniref:Uncharacterized protein n=1 Tax=Quillaja saponaria TaxID=32244 RepID=A0AAD7LUW9_QUISA|nr:hypothetical protein O6P43_014409 [Quillaja saponaria]